MEGIVRSVINSGSGELFETVVELVNLPDDMPPVTGSWHLERILEPMHSLGTAQPEEAAASGPPPSPVAQ